jgi:hypothetical protein
MDKLFEEFLREKKYLAGVARKTIVWYETSYKAYTSSSVISSITSGSIS